ncbi:acyl-CoA thioesterase domain-containing protein [Nocardioides convexus]|uniref:acyl-CoA thioesterase domain-containing protein n=1 Tax=Nocardioides convexus TaxID=2712224 RepID=UPI003101A6F9
MRPILLVMASTLPQDTGVHTVVTTRHDVRVSENTFQFAWFRPSPGTDAVEPLPLARSRWREDQMHGVAVSGLLARALERAVAAAGRIELVPARYHVDLFRPALMVPTTAEATVVREGPRLMLLDAVVRQEGEAVARAGATFLQPSTDPAGEVWTSDAERPVPPLDLLPPEGGAARPVLRQCRALVGLLRRAPERRAARHLADRRADRAR